MGKLGYFLICFTMINLSFQWVNFTYPFIKEERNITIEEDYFTFDVSKKEIVYLNSTHIIIYNVESGEKEYIQLQETLNIWGEIKVYFENDVSSFYNVLSHGGGLTIYKRETGELIKEYSGIGEIIMTENVLFMKEMSLVRRIYFPSLESKEKFNLRGFHLSGKKHITVGDGPSFLCNENFDELKVHEKSVQFIYPFLLYIPTDSMVPTDNTGIYDLATESLLGDYDETKKRKGILTCSSILLILTPETMRFLNYTEEKTLNNFPPDPNLITPGVIDWIGKCYEDQSQILTLGVSEHDYKKFILTLYKYGEIIQEIEEEEEELDSTVSENLEEEESEENSQTTHESSNFLMTIEKFNNNALSFLLSGKFMRNSENIASATGFLATNPLTRDGIRPLFNYFEDLWFYGFHPVEYPIFIKSFTEQVDILNVLKLKPSFLSYEIDIPWMKQNNYKYIDTRKEMLNAPETVFFLESIRDIYTSNFFMSMTQCFFFFFVKVIAQKFKQENKILFHIYRFLRNECLWFTIIVTIFEGCIVPISFYGGTQLNYFFSFDLLTKMNCVFALIALLTIILFSFSFFLLIQKYSKPALSQEILDFSENLSQSFWLETCTRLLRGLIQGLIHGLFLHLHPLELPFLAILDFMLLVIVLKHRKCFINSLLTFITFSYFLGFLFLDLFLFVYTIHFNEKGKQIEQNVIYNFISILVVLYLLVLASSKCLFFLGMGVANLFKGICKKEKIKEIKDEDHIEERNEIFEKERDNVKRFLPRALCVAPSDDIEAKSERKERTSNEMLLKIQNDYAETKSTYPFKKKGKNILTVRESHLKKSESFDQFEVTSNTENKENMPRVTKFSRTSKLNNFHKK